MPRKDPPSNPPDAPEKTPKARTPRSTKAKPVAKTEPVETRSEPTKAKAAKPAKVGAKGEAQAVVTEVRERPPEYRLPLPRRWELAVDALSSKKVATEDLLETLALTLALDAQGGLAKASLRHKDALRRVGSAALLRMGPGLEEEFAGISFAREGLRRLTQRAEAPRAEGRADVVRVSDTELRMFRSGAADGFQLAEIALRVERSTEARRTLAMLDALETPVVVPTMSGGLRLAAESNASPIRDPNEGRRVAELSLGAHAVELYRFTDGVLAAYSEPTVSVRLGGVGITRRQGRMGYAEALIGPEGDRVELEVAGERVTLELGIPSKSQFPPKE